MEAVDVRPHSAARRPVRLLGGFRESACGPSASLPGDGRVRVRPDPLSVLSLSGSGATWIDEDAENAAGASLGRTPEAGRPLGLHSGGGHSGGGHSGGGPSGGGHSGGGPSGGGHSVVGQRSGIALARSRSAVLAPAATQSAQSWAPDTPRRVHTPPASPVVERQRREREANSFLSAERERRREGRFEPAPRPAKEPPAARSPNAARSPHAARSPRTPKMDVRQKSFRLPPKEPEPEAPAPGTSPADGSSSGSAGGSTSASGSTAADRPAPSRRNSDHSGSTAGPAGPAPRPGPGREAKITITYHEEMSGAPPPPGVEPLRLHWRQDGDVDACARCSRAFGWLVRRHHCRVCGDVFCHACSSATIRLDMYCRPHPAGVPSRACAGCFALAAGNLGAGAGAVASRGAPPSASIDSLIDSVQVILGVKAEGS